MGQIKSKHSYNNPISLGIALFIILSLLLTLQIKINKNESLPKKWTNISNATEITYISTRKKIMMFDPVVKLSALSYEQSTGLSIPYDGVLLGSATGVSVNYDKTLDITSILTNHHFCEEFLDNQMLIMAIESSKKPRINMPNEDMSIGRVIKTDPKLDLCLVQTDGYLKPVKIARKKTPLIEFESVFIVGGPTGIFPTIIDTYISGRLAREEVTLPGVNSDGNSFIFLSGLIFPGHSGSPVFNKKYELVGLIFAQLESYGALAISLEDIYIFLEL